MGRQGIQLQEGRNIYIWKQPKWFPGMYVAVAVDEQHRHSQQIVEMLNNNKIAA